MNAARPSLLGKLNERQLLHLLQAQGPLSRAELARRSGLSAPTVSKAVASLLLAGLVEEIDAADFARGRPAKVVRPAQQATQVVGVVIDAERCQATVAGLDGTFAPDEVRSVATPNTYVGLLDALVGVVRDFSDRSGMTTLGVGLSMPGQIDYRRQRGVLSPNVPLTDGQAPARDLAERLGLECVLLQESHALCLAERHHGLAQGLDDFAMLDVSTGLGLGVMSGGRLLLGHSGLAGELGHIPAVENGRPCGCGNRGCLETVAGDSALAWRVSRRLGRKVNIEQVARVARAGKVSLATEVEETCRYLTVAAATVINLFNPATLFVHGRMFDVDDELFDRLVKQVRGRTLPPSFADCRIVQARGSKLQGAVTGIIQHLTSAIAPEVRPDFLYPGSRPEHAAGAKN